MNILADYTQPLLLFLCYIVRIVMMFRTMPIMGTTIIPQQTLVALVAVLLLPLLYSVINSNPPTIELNIHLVFILIKEVFLGMLLGLLFSMFFWIAQSVGYIIDNQRGATQSEGADPLSGDRLTPFASLLFQGVTVLFFTSGAFYTFLGAVYESYAIWPVLSSTPKLLSINLLHFITLKVGEYMTLVLSFAGPILIICFLSDFCLGIINRFAQQLNVFSLSMPIKSGLVLLILVLYGQNLFGMFNEYLPQLGIIFESVQRATYGE